MVEHLIAKAKKQKGGVFLWQDDWDALCRRLRSLEQEGNTMRRALTEREVARQSEIWRMA